MNDRLVWDDLGPNSQGKILTAVLRRRDDDATHMLRHWSSSDRLALRRALRRLDRIIAEVNSWESKK